jgi:hypothetical protein
MDRFAGLEQSLSYLHLTIQKMKRRPNDDSKSKSQNKSFTGSNAFLNSLHLKICIFTFSLAPNKELKETEVILVSIILVLTVSKKVVAVTWILARGRGLAVEVVTGERVSLTRESLLSESFLTTAF